MHVALAQEAVNSGGFAIADFNQDGKPDILYEATDSSFHILLNQGGGQFNSDDGPPRPPPLPQAMRPVERNSSRSPITTTITKHLE
jgi:hypothetical protein